MADSGGDVDPARRPVRSWSPPQALLSAVAFLLLRSPAVTTGAPTPWGGPAVSAHRNQYAPGGPAPLRRGAADRFRFGRFFAPSAVASAFDGVRRRPGSFRPHRGRDGRAGSVCSTRLGGDWVLGESEQVLPSCTCGAVLRAYLDADLNRRWCADRVLDMTITQARRASAGGELRYRQDMVLRSQRVLASTTGVMAYSHSIAVDAIGRGDYCALVEIDPDVPGTERRPFDSLSVYVSLTQEGPDVRVYAAGVMEVNRKVVPNLIVFDASGIAGDQAGKGTLWLSAHFKQKAAAAVGARGRWTPGGLFRRG